MNVPVLLNLPHGSRPSQPGEPSTIRRQLWEVADPLQSRRGFGRSVAAARADVMDDYERIQRYGHTGPPGYRRHEGDGDWLDSEAEATS